MRQGPSGRRSRGRHHSSGNGGGGNVGPSQSQGGSGRPRSAASLRHQTFDSNGPDVRVRGNAWQVYEKYQALARDATSAGDRVGAENLMQHAEHYYRIIEAINDATAAEQRQRGGPTQPFGQQPDVPANYYTPDGQLAMSDGAAQPQMAEAQPQPAQAEVQRIRPVQNAFLAPDEADDMGVQEPMMATR